MSLDVSLLERVVQRAWRGRGPLAVALLPLAALYAVVMLVRRALFRFGWKHVIALDVPVVVVGNLIVGGAGKTPTVMAAATLLQEAGWRPGIVTRGYGRTGEGLVDVQPDTAAAVCGDEPLLMRRRLGMPVSVGRDRVSAARRLRELHPDVDVILADDGLQHLRLGRDVEVLVFDERGLGNGWLLPAGPLREGLGARTGRHIILYNAHSPTTPLPGFLATRQLSGAVSLADWQAGLKASPAALAALVGRPVVAVAGTARPGRFFDMLRAVGLDIIDLPRPDHDSFDILPWPAATQDVVVTEKDAVKLLGRPASATKIWVVPLDFFPEAAFGQALLDALATPTNRG